MRTLSLFLLLPFLPASLARAEAPFDERGEFTFRPNPDEAEIPERYRLPQRTVPFQLQTEYTLPISEVQIQHLTFPSPVPSAIPENNTVHATYYRPIGKGPFPAVIILDVLAGDQALSKGLGMLFAQQRIAGLFVQMAHYGPRRPAGSKVRLLSPNLEQTMAAIRQSVLDCRTAAAWLSNRPEVNPNRLGILGTSMGSFIAGLTAEMDSRIVKVALLLSGGNLVESYYEHPKAKPYRGIVNFLTGGKQKLAELLAPIDPITCADRLKRRDLLMIACRRDSIVPAAAAEALWAASGKQTIHWYDTDHYGAAFYAVPILQQILHHFAHWSP